MYGEMLENVDRKDDAVRAFEAAAAACSAREMQAEAEQWAARARAIRSEAPRDDSDDVGSVADLMSLRTLDEPVAAEGQPGASPWALYDPSKNPDIPPPPPLPGRRASRSVSRPTVEAPSELAPAATAEPPVTMESPKTETAEAPEAVELELEPRAASVSTPSEEEAEAPATELNDFFGSGAAAAPVDESEHAVVVGDDFELVREGGDVHEVINDFMEATMELLDLDDHQAHYDLGTTYMEMELFDEAAQEFEISARGPELALASQEMLGYCFLRKGQIDLAIHELEKGLSFEGADERDKLGLLYNLGVASRVVDQEKRAIECFRRILGIDPDFRDTKDRLERLVES
jgi:tetratricopeptide (TPR) repeat protein